MKEVQYSSECPALPVDRPRGYPHVVDFRDFDEETDDTTLHFADGVATFLWLWNKDSFRRFFDLEKDTFEIHYRAPNSYTIKDMIISRRSRWVTAGFRVFDKEYQEWDWDTQLIFEIDGDGKWQPKLCSAASIPEVIDGYGRSFTRAMLFNELWKLKFEGTKVDVNHE